MMRAPDGTRWGRVAEAAAEFGVRHWTIRSWVRRGHVRQQRIDQSVYVCLDDVADAERGWAARPEPLIPKQRGPKVRIRPGIIG